MIKRIIFDIDNTLIPYIDDYDNAFIEAYKEVGIECNIDIITSTNEAINTYENFYNVYKYEYLKKHIENITKLNIPDKFINIWMDNLSKCFTLSENTKEVLEYLYNKYELVILTNWFSKAQLNRLKSAGIDKYFKEVIGTEEVLNKPNKEAFIKACGPYKAEECIMVGDNLEIDIIPARKLNMRAIYFTNSEKGEDIVNNLIELKEML